MVENLFRTWVFVSNGGREKNVQKYQFPLVYKEMFALLFFVKSLEIKKKKSGFPASVEGSV